MRRRSTAVLPRLSLMAAILLAAAAELPFVPAQSAAPVFFLGGPRLGLDGMPLPLRGEPGERIELSFYYRTPPSAGAASRAHMQGVSMAICHDCSLVIDEGSFAARPDSITHAIGADFVAFQADGSSRDGDGCEMVLAILVEARAPFRGDTLPVTDQLLKLATVEAEVAAEAPCGEAIGIAFCDGANARGQVPVKNLYASENKSFSARGAASAVAVDAPRKFLRGDCTSDGRFNVLDAVAIVFNFAAGGPGNLETRCRDACDANDDGRLDVSDALYLLAYLFQRGQEPPAPGVAAPGIDPTADSLDCQLGCTP